MRTLIAMLMVLAAPAMAQTERLVGGPCEGCEAVFQAQPTQVGSVTQIAPAGEPGERLALEGIVRSSDGKPAPGIIVYAYHTNAAGLYPAADDSLRGLAAHRHGKLRGFARTDAAGRYRFETVRPGAYPGTDIAQHIHIHIIEPGRCTYYIDDVLFDDDPRLTEAQRRAAREARGGPGVVKPRRDGTAWRVERNIELGRGIRDYAACRG